MGTMYDEKESIAIIAMLQLTQDGMAKQEKVNVQKNEYQTSVLTKVFEISRFPSEENKKDLGYILKLSYRTIQVWFQNRRQRDKEVRRASGYLGMSRLYRYHENLYERHNSSGSPISHEDLVSIATDALFEIWSR